METRDGICKIATFIVCFERKVWTRNGRRILLMGRRRLKNRVDKLGDK
jgi:hypothetical protein